MGRTEALRDELAAQGGPRAAEEVRSGVHLGALGRAAPVVLNDGGIGSYTVRGSYWDAANQGLPPSQSHSVSPN